MKSIIVSASLLVLVIASACKKDEVKAKTKLDYITTGTWKYSKAEVKVDNGNFEDKTSTIWKACDLDDYFTFKADNTYDLNQGATKCVSSDPQIKTAAWKFESSDTKLNINGEVYDIETINETTVSGTTTKVVSGLTIVTRTIFSH